MGVPPVLIHLNIGIFPNQPAKKGYPHDHGNPHLVSDGSDGLWSLCELVLFHDQHDRAPGQVESVTFLRDMIAIAKAADAAWLIQALMSQIPIGWLMKKEGVEIGWNYPFNNR